MRTNLFAGWVAISLGFVAGAVPGLFFWLEDWLGGYGSWRRRLVRLAHISFFGLGFINVLFALSVAYLGLDDRTPLLGWSSTSRGVYNCPVFPPVLSLRHEDARRGGPP